MDEPGVQPDTGDKPPALALMDYFVPLKSPQLLQSAKKRASKSERTSSLHEVPDKELEKQGSDAY